MNYEILGILASTLVLVSFLFKKERSIRLVNIFGAIMFVIYGLLINALSVWLLNGILIFIHLYYLHRD